MGLGERVSVLVREGGGWGEEGGFGGGDGRVAGWMSRCGCGYWVYV